MFVNRKVIKEKNPIKISGLLIILLKQDFTQKQTDIEKVKKQYERFRSLNPKYSELVIPLKEAKLKVASSDIIYSSQYNIFRVW